MSGLTADTPFYIVFNAASGSGDAQQAHEEMEAVFKSAGRRYEFLPIEDPGRIAAVTERAAQLAVANAGAVIAAGGDGTINAAVQAVLPTGRPFGIVPQGTFNYSSRTHGIPLETGKAASALLTARLKPVQVGAINERIFLVNASLGLYPQLLQDREQYKRQFGRKRAVAFGAGLITLLRYRGQMVLEIEHDAQREIVRTPTLFIGNNALQLDQLGLPEAEDVEQRRLAAIMVKPVSPLEVIWLVLRGALGQLGDDDRIRDFAFRRMVVRPLRHSNRPIKVATDGEVCWMRAPLEFSLKPRPLLLMVPAGDANAT